MSSLGRQVRQAFYGEEAQRIQRGQNELKVMVRYPLDERRSIADLENMRIRTPSGDEVPFGSVAEVSFGEAYSTRRFRKTTYRDCCHGIPVSSTASKERASKNVSSCATSRWRQSPRYS